MDPIKLEKIKAINKYRKNELLKNLLFYALTTIASLYLLSPLWLPFITSSMEVLLFVYVPKLPSLFFSSKFVFIVGNLIIVALIGESKIFSSSQNKSSPIISTSTSNDHSYYEEYISTSAKQIIKYQVVSAPPHEEKKVICIEEEEKKMITWAKVDDDDEKKIVVVEKKLEDFHNDDEVITTNYLPNEDLKKRADDFIARVNKQRVFEAREMLSSDDFEY
ncbi:hypothetical protein G4B88_027698 [Cannabis sativa]|uniref:DUF4408 domain-containing protein n=1 Tax=Cannabis sativa TaxID=3483 RepID=A0A7J6ERZ0_CANSA|nr:hypothetical protein G4B88_027698 [Cannabis sativa]